MTIQVTGSNPVNSTLKMNRTQTYQLLTKHLHNKNLVKHCLATEAAMEGIYNHLYQGKSSYARATADKWKITGLLHDVDYEIAQAKNGLDHHGLLIFDIEPDVIPEDIAYAIKSHNFHNTKVLPKSDMDWAVTTVDGLTGLIVSCALIHPEKKLTPLTPKFVLKRFGQTAFSRGVDREIIKLCEEKLNIPLEKFITITLISMQSVHADLGL